MRKILEIHRKMVGNLWKCHGICMGNVFFLVENDGKLMEKCMAWLMVQLWKQIWDVFRQNMGQVSDDMGSFFFFRVTKKSLI